MAPCIDKVAYQFYFIKSVVRCTNKELLRHYVGFVYLLTQEAVFGDMINAGLI